MASRHRAASKPGKAAARGHWSAGVSRRSTALHLRGGVFTLPTAQQIAKSLKRSAEASKRRKAQPFQSAMSMLNFEINRAGKNLAPAQRSKLERAKQELRKAFGRPGKSG